MSLRRAQTEIDSAEFAGWMAFYRVCPWGAEMDWERAGTVAAAVRNSFRAKTDPAFRPDDFIPDFSGRRAAARHRPQDPAQMMAILKTTLKRVARKLEAKEKASGGDRKPGGQPDGPDR